MPSTMPKNIKMFNIFLPFTKNYPLSIGNIAIRLGIAAHSKKDTPIIITIAFLCSLKKFIY